MKKFVVVLASVMAVMLTGCGGGGANVRSEVTTVSKGQSVNEVKRHMGDAPIRQNQ